MSEDCNINMV